MIFPLKHIQTRLSKRSEGQFGNCIQTAIACLLRLDIEDVPRFEVGFWDKKYDWCNAVEAWAKHQGYITIFDTNEPKKGFSIAAGKSPRGTGHVCVYERNTLWHDVHPSGTGLSDVEFWFWFIPAERDMSGFHADCIPNEDVK